VQSNKAGQPCCGGGASSRDLHLILSGTARRGIRLLLLQRKQRDFPSFRSHEHLPPPAVEELDVIQIGARNMQNIDLLKEVGKLDKPSSSSAALANHRRF
jgi:3-deoxy-7-phosphoheptulonate synthase